MTDQPQDTPAPSLPPELQAQAQAAEAAATIDYLQQRCTVLHANLMWAQTQLAEARELLEKQDNATG